MLQASKHGIKSVVELRRNLRRANMDSPHKHRVSSTWEANKGHHQNDRHEPREHPASEREPIKGIHNVFHSSTGID